MCVVSAMGDQWRNTFPTMYPTIAPVFDNLGVSQAELEAVRKEFKKEMAKLRKDMQELVTLLKAAKKYDEATGQKDCEMAEKIDFLKKMANLLDVDISEVFN